MKLLAVIAALTSTTGYQIIIHHGNNTVWAEFKQAGESCRYTQPGTILCYSTHHTKRGDYGVFFTPTKLAVVQYEPGKLVVRYAATER